MRVIVEQLVEWRLAGETEVLLVSIAGLRTEIRNWDCSKMKEDLNIRPVGFIRKRSQYPISRTPIQEIWAVPRNWKSTVQSAFCYCTNYAVAIQCDAAI
jgi:hypothetical protein